MEMSLSSKIFYGVMIFVCGIGAAVLIEVGEIWLRKVMMYCS
jgi:hypothetical protein